MAFKPHTGQCPQCPEGHKSIIPTKRGLCNKHLYEFKQSGKPFKAPVTIDKLKEKGLVKIASDMAPDWKKKADALFSEWIRRRHADSNGEVGCVTCPVKKQWKYMTCGHYHKRRHLGTRFEDRACLPQCYQCQADIESNKLLEHIFLAKLIALYGVGIEEELNNKRNSIVQLRDDDYRQLCEDIKLKIESL